METTNDNNGDVENRQLLPPPPKDKGNEGVPDNDSGVGMI